MNKRDEVLKELLLGVCKIDGCWEWQKWKDKDGYGLIKIEKSYHRAHRVSWSLHNSEIPEGLVVMHLCDNPRCVNPNHLALGTVAANNFDRNRKGRSAKGDQNGSRKYPERVSKGIRKARAEKPERFARGERSARSRLKPEQVIEIRRAYAAKELNQVQLAEIYKISQASLSYLILRKSWKHI